MDCRMKSRTGASFAAKENFSKAEKKHRIGGRIPLCNISNSLSFGEKETGVSKRTDDSIKKKCVSDPSKKNQTAKLSSRLAEDPNIAEEGMLHKHEECIKAQKRAINMNEVLLLLDLDDFCKQSKSEKEVVTLNEMEAMSPPRYFEPLIEDLSPPKPMISKNSAPSSPEPLSFEYFDDFMDIPSFKLIEP